MRFDSIDLIGEFKIKGAVGSAGQAIGLSGSEFTWVDAVSVPITAFGLTGTNYVVCQSGTNSVDNGNLLRDAYATASAIAIQTSERTSVLLTPGLYDLNNTSLLLDTTLVDIVGISPDPSAVTIKALTSNFIFQLSSNVDTGLANLTLDPSSNLYCFDNDGNTGDYLRWENIVINGGSVFTDDFTSYNDLSGEFRNIKMNNCTNGLSIQSGNLDGIFENIEINNVSSNFFSYGNVYGTYSNIKLFGNSNYFFSANDIIGKFSDIEVWGVCDYVFQCSNLNGIYQNIEIKNTSDIAFEANNMDGIYTNIHVDNTNRAFCVNYNLLGTFSNIKIGDCNVDVFSSRVGGDINGEFRNIELANVGGIAFSNVSGNLYGDYRYITIGNVTQSCFETVNGVILANVDQMNCKNIVENLFYSDLDISGSFTNCNFQNVSSNLFGSSASTINGYFENINANICKNVFKTETGIYGSYKNINIGSASFFFDTSGPINAHLDDIGINFVYHNCLKTIDEIYGTFSNLNFGTIGSFFMYTIGGSVSGTFENINLESISLGFTTLANLIGKFENINVKYVNSTCFQGNYLSGVFKNIKVNYAGNSVFQSTTSIDSILENIDVGYCYDFCYPMNLDLSGTFSKIKIGTAFNSAFNPANGTLFGTYRDINIDIAPLLMGCQTFSDTTMIDSLVAKSSFIVSGSGFRGTILNSVIDARSYPHSAINLDYNTVATIERCKFLTDVGINSISMNQQGTSSISYTSTNNGISPPIVNILAGNDFNIDNPNII